jgi:SAM-dependent MidA family methyltransferase
MRWQKSRVKLPMELVELDAGQGEFADQLEARFRQFKKTQELICCVDRLQPVWRAC